MNSFTSAQPEDDDDEGSWCQVTAAPALPAASTARTRAGAGPRLAGEADVIVVGAGPGGSTTAYYLAQAGLDVLVLEKTSFPREKVCGDGLTPRAVRQLVRMGIDTSGEPAWRHNHGLRIMAGGLRLHIPWPDLAEFPSYGLVRTRLDFDDILVRHAQKAGARLHEETTVRGPVLDERTGRVVGVTARQAGSHEEVAYHAPLVVAADGNSSRLATALGRHQRANRPMGVAVRTYFTSPRHEDDWLESWLELWQQRPDGGRNLLPGYGWIFGVGDGTSNVGLGILNTSSAFGQTDYRQLLRDWLAGVPEEWGFNEANQVGPIRGAALPMGFNRQPHYDRGVLLVGDSGGMVNPCNGEGIAYAMEAGELAAEVIVQALARSRDVDRERALTAYPRVLADTYGGYYTVGRAFVKLIGNPQIMRLATRYGLPHPVLMRLMLKLLANLTEPTGGDAMDRLVNGLSKIAPAA